MFESSTTGIERPEKIDVDYRFESISRHSERWRRKIPCCPTNENVDHPEFIASRFDRRCERFVVANIRGKSFRLSTFPFDSLCSSVELFLCSSNEPNSRTLFRESLRDAEVDAASPAGDHCDFSTENTASECRAHFRSVVLFFLLRRTTGAEPCPENISAAAADDARSRTLRSSDST